MAEFFHMGGYAFFVWTSYGLAAVILIVNVLIPLFRRRELIHELERKRRRDRSAHESAT